MKKGLYIIPALLLAVALCGCSAKMTTVRPAEISEMRVTRLSDGAQAVLPSSPEEADIKDRLIFTLEEPYDRAGSCGEEDEHAYLVQLYILQKLDTEVIINADGSVCRGKGRYVASAQADAPVDIADWDALFN